MPHAEPLIHWPKPVLELAGFVAAFLAAGAVGFRFGVLARLRRLSPALAEGELQPLVDVASRRAALLGLAGAVAGLLLFATELPALAARQHAVSLIAFIRSDGPTATRIVLFLCALAGFALARARRTVGWSLAALGLIAGALRPAFFGHWARLPNPIHMLAAGLWIGTLFVLLVAGFSSVFRSRLAPERRGEIAATMVNAFSPVALWSAGVLAVLGGISAWQHLVHPSALWTTLWGWTLIAKLCVVLVLVALSAWNWRQRSRLGTESAAIALARSARAGLIAAAIVLAITAILVSVPAPRDRPAPRAARPGRQQDHSSVIRADDPASRRTSSIVSASSARLSSR